VRTILPQQSQINWTSATRSLASKILTGKNYSLSLGGLSFSSRSSTYSLIVQLFAFARFLMSSCIFSVTVMHLYPFRGKRLQSPFRTLRYSDKYIINGKS
jgi:predicted neutral ceramidase superfamily lipid hydrolase